MTADWEAIIKSLNWTLIINVVSFLLLVWLLKRIAFSPVLRWLDARRKLEEERVLRAKALEAEAETLRKKAEQELTEANRQARTILAQAEAQAHAIVRHAREEAREEARRILKDAEAAAGRLQQQALVELRRAYAELVVFAAAQVLGREVRFEDHQRLLDDLTARLGPGLLT